MGGSHRGGRWPPPGRCVSGAIADPVVAASRFLVGPGVTSLAKTGGQYGLPRLDIVNDQVRAAQIYLGLRTILGLDGVRLRQNDDVHPRAVT